MLRDYQQQIYNAIRRELCQHDGVCAVLPCRSGKSWIMKAIVDSAAAKGNNVLILAHRNLLLDQHRELIKNCRIESVFTEVNHLGEHEPPQLIIIDEAHLSNAASYLKVCEFYKCKRILFTATACRLDGSPLKLADVIVNGISADELIVQGFVSPYNLYAPKLSINLDRVSMVGGDFNNGELAQVMLDRKIYGDIIKYFYLYAKDKQAIAYCTNVAHSESICELFNSNGITARHISGNTPERERQQIMDDFRRGEFKILCNCNLISEGITLPECDCCLLLRPTQSEALYIQQACRCLTPRENKVATIIDFVGNCYTHGMPTEKRTYNLEPRKPRNRSREPDILVRQCKNCYRAYRGTAAICPYCNFNNGKTRQQIKADEQAELERIEQIEKQNYNKDLKNCITLQDFQAFAQVHGYKQGWAFYRWKAKQEILKKYKKN